MFMVCLLITIAWQYAENGPLTSSPAKQSASAETTIFWSDNVLPTTTQVTTPATAMMVPMMMAVIAATFRMADSPSGGVCPLGPAELSPRTELTAVFGMSGDDRARLARTGINSAGFRRSMWRGQASMTRVSCAASTTSTMLASSWLMLVSPLTALGERVDQPSTRHRGSGGFDRVLHPRPASGGSVRAGSAIRSIQQEPLLRCQPAAPTVGGDRGRRAAGEPPQIVRDSAGSGA